MLQLPVELPPEVAVGHPPAPADVFSCDLAETMAQRSLLDRDDLRRMALGTAVLAHDPADRPLIGAVALQQDHDSPATTLRAQKYPVATKSLSIAFSSSTSAKRFLSRAFSFSS
jgi:hypothetical protein